MSTEVLKKLADFFEVSIDYLLCHNAYCLYITYELGKCMYKVNKVFHDFLVSNGFIYFNDYDNRCVDLNKLLGVEDKYDASMLINELVRVKNLDRLFDKKDVKLADFEKVMLDSNEVSLDMKLISKVKEIIRNI